MTEDDAWSFVDLMHGRFLGWAVALGAVGEKTDFRTKRARDAHHLMHDIMFSEPSSAEICVAVLAGDDVAMLWPECLRDAVRFQVNHRVPREQNEPLGAIWRQRRAEGMGWPISPIFDDHGALATVDDHPPLPEWSPDFAAWMRDGKATKRRARFRLVSGGRP